MNAAQLTAKRKVFLPARRGAGSREQEERKTSIFHRVCSYLQTLVSSGLVCLPLLPAPGSLLPATRAHSINWFGVHSNV